MKAQPAELRDLLYFLVDSILDRQPPVASVAESLSLIQLST